MGRDCFISYSHRADAPLTTAVENGLSKIGRSWRWGNGLSIFRDTQSLAASTDLPGAIRRELEQTRYFLYIASREAAASHWVGEELRFWRDHQDPTARERFLIALSDGEIHWDKERGDFDWSRTTAIPEDLRGVFRTEPLWVDLREYRASEERSLAPGAEFRGKVVTLAAAVRGCTKDELESEDLRRVKRLALIRRTTISVLLLLVMALVVTLFFAVQQRDDARERARTSAAQALAARAVQAAGSDPRLAAQYALYADALKPTSESRGALARAVDANSYAVRHFQGGSGVVALYSGSGGGTPTRVALSGDGSLFAYYTGFDVNGPKGEKGGRIHLHETATGRALPSLKTQFPLGGGEFALSENGRVLAMENTYNTIDLWDTRAHRKLRTIAASDGSKLCNACLHLRAFALSDDGTRVAAAFLAPEGEDESPSFRLAVWDTATGKRSGSLRFPEDTRVTLSFGEDDVLRADFPEEGAYRRFVSGAWGAPGSRPVTKLSDNLSEIPDLTVTTPRGTRLRIGAEHGTVLAEDTRTRTRTTLGAFPFAVQSLSASDDGAWVAAGSDDGAVSLYRTRDTSVRTLPNKDGLTPEDLSRDGRTATRTVKGGKTDVWLLTDPRKGPRYLGRLPVVAQSVAVSPDGRRLVAGTNDGGLLVWDADTKGGTRGRDLVPQGPYTYGSGNGEPLAVLGGGDFVAGVWENAVKVVDLRTRKVVRTLSDDTLFYTSLATSRDGRTLALGDDDGFATVWRLGEDGAFKRLRHTRVSQDMLANVAMSEDGTKVLGTDRDARVSVLDVPSGRVATASVVPGAAFSAAFSDDGRFVAQAAETGSGSRLAFWDSATGDTLGSWPLGAEGAPAPAPVLAPAPGGGVLALTGDGTLTRRSLAVTTWHDRLCALSPSPLSDADYRRYLSGLGTKVGNPCP